MLLGSLMEKSSETASASFEDLHPREVLSVLKVLGYEVLVPLLTPTKLTRSPVRIYGLRMTWSAILVWASRLNG